MKKLLNKKGFTLVELMAVIVILAIIMLVVANRVGEAMKNSRTNSFVMQVESMQREFEKECVMNNKITQTKIEEILAGSDLTKQSVPGAPASDITLKAIDGSKFANVNFDRITLGELTVKGVKLYPNPDSADAGDDVSSDELDDWKATYKTSWNQNPQVTITISCPILAS